MYGNNITPGAKWIFMIIVFIAILSILVGFNLKEATWLNSSIAKAEAERIQINSAHQQATYDLQKRLAATQTKADIQNIRREQKILDTPYEYDTQGLNQDPLHHGFTYKLWKIIFMIFGGILIIAAIIGTILSESSKLLASICFDPA